MRLRSSSKKKLVNMDGDAWLFLLSDSIRPGLRFSDELGENALYPHGVILEAGCCSIIFLWRAILPLWC